MGSSFQWASHPHAHAHAHHWPPSYTSLLGIDDTQTQHDNVFATSSSSSNGGGGTSSNSFPPTTSIASTSTSTSTAASSSSAAVMTIDHPLSQLMLTAPPPPPSSHLAPPSSSPSSQHRPKRMMGVSCDACKLRKVKCDRKDKLARRRAERGAGTFDEDDVVCTNCSTHSVRCTFTKHTPKPRVGARLRQLKHGVGAAKDSEDSSMELTATATATTQGSSPSPVPMPLPSISSSTAPRPPPPAIEQGDTWSYWDTRVIRNFGLFQVPGLTRPLLDGCLSAYFKWSAPASTPLRGCDFAAGYRAFFERYAGASPATAIAASSGAPAEPVSENLIIALAAAGAGVLEDEAPLFGMNKFDLQERLVARFIEKLGEQRWTERSDEDSVDLLIACYVLSFWDIEGGEPPASEADPFTRRPLSEEFLASLVFKLGLNRAPKLEPRAPRDGPRWRTGRGERLLDDYEAIRRKRTFLSVFYNDGFRALGARKPLNFSVDCHDHDHSMPRWPRYDGGFTPSGPLPPTLSPQGESHPAFEAIYLSHAAKLSALVREASSLFVSVRAQTLGVPLRPANKILHRLCEWLATVPPEVKLDRYIPADWARGHDARPQCGYEFFKMIRCLFWEMLYHGAVMGTCSAVQDFGLRADDDEGGGGGGSTPMSEEEAREQKEATLAKFKAAAFLSLRRVATIARRCGTLGILRCHIVVCRNLAAGYCLWALDCITESWKADVDACGGPSGGAGRGGETGMDEAHRRAYPVGHAGSRPSNDELLHLAEEILFGVSTADSSKSTPQTVRGLQDNLAKVKAAMAAGRAVGASGASAGQAAHALQREGPIAASIEELFLPPFAGAGTDGGQAQAQGRGSTEQDADEGAGESQIWDQSPPEADEHQNTQRQQQQRPTKKGSGKLGGWILEPRGLDALFARANADANANANANAGSDGAFTFLPPQPQAQQQQQQPQQQAQPSHPLSDAPPPQRRNAGNAPFPPPDLPADLLAMYAPPPPQSSSALSLFSPQSPARSAHSQSQGDTAPHSSASSGNTPATSMSADSGADKAQAGAWGDAHTQAVAMALFDSDWSFLSDK